MRFGDFVGNERIKKQLAAEIDGGRYPHALLLEGAEGTGRKTLARLIARAALCRCEDHAARPCGVCAACQKSVHPDMTEMGGEGAALTVDAIRRLRDEAFFMPNESAYRVLILTEAQHMRHEAQNALLKILEEPPAHVLFILTCDKRTSMLETIRSRCVCLALSPVTWDEAAPVLRQRLPRIPEEELRQAHGLFGGSIGQVIDGVGDGTFRQVLELVPKMAAAVIAPAELELMRLTGSLEKDKPLTIGVLAGLGLVFRDALVLKYGGDGMLSTSPDTARLLAARLTAPRLIALMEQIERLEYALDRNMNNTLLLTRMCACLRQVAGT
ncbi:MAG: DNA polymerase III subunit [Clostridia bacterium]|nr:DNA polymerase III subunit [Clostridia bacterium]